MRKILTDYFLATDLKESLAKSSLPRFIRNLGMYVSSKLPNLASLGAIYHFRQDPESLALSLGAIENLRVWTKYSLMQNE